MQAFELISKFLYLTELLNNFHAHMDSKLSHLPAWFGEKSVNDDKAPLKQAFSEWSYDSEVGHSTLSCPGALAGTVETLQLVVDINAAKDDFKTFATKYLKDHQLTNTKLIRQLLKQAGFPGIRLRQVYRHIRTLSFHPKRISFTQTHHNTYRIISKEEALLRLQKVGSGPNIDWQKAKLASISDEKLVIRHDIKPLWAVNASTFKFDTGRSQYLKLLTRLPVVYLHDETQPLSLVGFSRPYQRHQKKPRSDKRIESTPFLPSIFAYRYKAMNG
tara:strand:- start:2937 stop:3758 length:822 start_codon:yes stop_codon:yes gene_type:complete